MAIGESPVGNMVIKVDLDAAGVEKSMTGLQRQLKSSNTSMGAQLSAFGRAEKSAKKYGVQISGLSDRHKIQGAMVSEARKKHQKMNEEYGEGSVKSQQAAQDLNKQISMYEETGRQLNSMESEFKEFQRVQDIQSKGWYKAADGMDEFGGKLKGAGRVMDNTGQKLTRGVSLPLAIVGGVAIKTGSDFEAGMSKVGAVSGASAGDMEMLENKAREMGKTTVFSAKETSDAFYYMSLAGWDAEQSMDGIAGVMDLAAASGEDLAQVSDIVTDGLTAFGLEAEDSGKMADVLASASANANTDVAGLGKAFSYVAPVAGALGYAMEDTSIAIGLMSNAGIKSQKAGTALRSMMTSISDPTGEAKEAMEKYGISLTDSEGEMKSFDDVMGDLRKGIGDLSEDQQAQAASTIFGKEAMSGALAIINTSEEDYNKLSGAINDSEGAAAEMAETMQDNLQGSLKELKSMAEDLFITLYKDLKPGLESIVEGAKDLTNWFAELSPKTQENIIKFGLLAAALGPVLSITGKLTYGMGGLVQGAGGLVKAIGLGGGTGLVGAMSALGPLAAGGIAVAGIVGISAVAYKLKKDSEELEGANYDLAKSFSDQALELDQSVTAFDKLSDKANVSNKELARLNDLNIMISESSNPGEINELQKQYDKLATKSGLSKEELEKLFIANSNIIEQSPEVKSSVSDQGNAFVENTEAVKKYIDSLHEMSMVELDGERTKQLENEKALREELTHLQEIYNKSEGELQHLLDGQKMTKDEIWDRQAEINELYYQGNLSEAEKAELMREHGALQSALNEDVGKEIKKRQSTLEKQREGINNIEEELSEVEALDLEYANILLKRAGINAEGEKGLVALDKSLAKNDEELAKLDQKLKKNGSLTEEEQKQYNKLVETNEKQNEAKGLLFEKLGIFRDLNSLAEQNLSTADKEVQKKVVSLAKSAEIKVEEGNIIQQLQVKNGEHDKSIAKLEEERQKNGANKGEIDKQISALQTKKGKNSEIIQKVLEELGIWDKIDSEIRKGITGENEKGGSVDSTTGKLRNQGSTIDNNNRKTDIGTGKERERSAEASRDVSKDVDVKDNGSVAMIDRAATAPKDKKVTAFDGGSVARIDFKAMASKSKNINVTDNGTVGILESYASRPLSKVVNIVARGFTNYAASTHYDKKNMVIIGGS